MKYLMLIVAVVSLLSCEGSDTVTVGNKTTMEIDPIYDAGTVIKGEMIEAKFKVKNTGSYPLVIADVVGSCTCTIGEKPDAPILPGEEGEIKAYVNTDRTGTGIINKTIDVTANSIPHVTRLVVKGNVVVK